MVSQALNFDDAGFQGILGLGVPNLTARIRRGSGGAGTSHRCGRRLVGFVWFFLRVPWQAGGPQVSSLPTFGCRHEEG